MKPAAKRTEKRGTFTVKQRVQLEKNRNGPKGKPEFQLSPDPTPNNPTQQRLEIDVPFKSWMIVKEDFFNPAQPIIEVEELE